jgi:hypothetical protein
MNRVYDSSNRLTEEKSVVGSKRKIQKMCIGSFWHRFLRKENHFSLGQKA